MEEYLLDTNILIYTLEGREKIFKFLFSLKREYFFTSVISHFEFLVGARSERESKEIKESLKGMAHLDVDLKVIQRALDLHKGETGKLKFKDLLIAATAQVEGLTLITADKDFKKIKGLKVKCLAL